MAEVETKHDKFKRLAMQRVTNALKKIELIGNLATSSYESSPGNPSLSSRVFILMDPTGSMSLPGN